MGKMWMDRLDLPEETLPSQTVVEIVDRSRVLIEHHLGIVQYCAELICVKVKFGCIQVGGHCLQLAQMTNRQLVISGDISSIELVGGRIDG